MIYSPSKQRWLKGEIYEIFKDRQTKEEWLIVKYNQIELEIVQRFSNCLRPSTITMDIDSDIDVDQIRFGIYARVHNVKKFLGKLFLKATSGFGKADVSTSRRITVCKTLHRFVPLREVLSKC